MFNLQNQPSYLTEMSDLPICIELKPPQTFVISKKNLMADGRHFNIDKSAYASEAH